MVQVHHPSAPIYPSPFCLWSIELHTNKATVPVADLDPVLQEKVAGSILPAHALHKESLLLFSYFLKLHHEAV